MGFFLLEADVAGEVGLSDIYSIWYVMFENWEYGSISLDSTFVGQFLPFTLGRRRPNSFEFPCSQWSASGTCNNVLRDSCLMDSGVVAREVIWWVYFSWKSACSRYCEATLRQLLLL